MFAGPFLTFVTPSVLVASFPANGYDRVGLSRFMDGKPTMVNTRQQAIEIAAKARQALKELYDGRLRGVYLYGSAARDQLTADSDIDIAVILNGIPDRFAEHERTSQLASELSLEYDTLVTFLFVTETDFAEGTFLIYRIIKREGIPA